MRKFSQSKKPVAKPKQKGFILYDGASVLDGAPIVVIATLETRSLWFINNNFPVSEVPIFNSTFIASPA